MFVYVRRNIEKKTRTSEDGESQEYYSYEEAVMTKDQYIQELHEEQEITEQAIQDLILSMEV